MRPVVSGPSAHGRIRRREANGHQRARDAQTALKDVRDSRTPAEAEVGRQRGPAEIEVDQRHRPPRAADRDREVGCGRRLALARRCARHEKHPRLQIDVCELEIGAEDSERLRGVVGAFLEHREVLLGAGAAVRRDPREQRQAEGALDLVLRADGSIERVPEQGDSDSEKEAHEQRQDGISDRSRGHLVRIGGGSNDGCRGLQQLERPKVLDLLLQVADESPVPRAPIAKLLEAALELGPCEREGSRVRVELVRGERPGVRRCQAGCVLAPTALDGEGEEIGVIPGCDGRVLHEFGRRQIADLRALDRRLDDCRDASQLRLRLAEPGGIDVAGRDAGDGRREVLRVQHHLGAGAVLRRLLSAPQEREDGKREGDDEDQPDVPAQHVGIVGQCRVGLLFGRHAHPLSLLDPGSGNPADSTSAQSTGSTARLLSLP